MPHSLFSLEGLCVLKIAIIDTISGNYSDDLNDTFRAQITLKWYHHMLKI